ncbi:MAG: 2-C-methyl-D-erythritol 4-phosphate cytidylyltransferase, partial [bacterium]
MTVDVIVPAAGKGSRMQAAKNKMFLEIYGVPILYRTLKQLEKSPLIQRILIVLKKGEKNDFQALLDQFGAIPKIMGIVYGGKERVDSVKNGLAFLEKNNASDIVMVHDGARPFFSPQLIENLVKGVNEIGAAVPVLPLEDTIRQKTGTSTSATVIDRNLLMRTQTPQAFR